MADADARRSFQVYTTRVGGPLEWTGLAIIKEWLRRTRQGIEIRDVHSDKAWFERGIDLVLSGEFETETIDVKVDSYFGTDSSKKERGWYNPDSNAMLVETTSQLQYDRENLGRRADKPGWFFTSAAKEIYYYFLAVTGPYPELRELHTEAKKLAKTGQRLDAIESRLIQSVRVERDLLLKYDVAEARRWWASSPDSVKGVFVGAANPQYVTVSRRVDRTTFTTSGPGRAFGSIISIVQASG